ncbi:MAG: hypothetical protein GKS05_00665 [Nitrospirales bacterium]|nr:hypothetical protein [Nitrospirales bacterium]
MMRSSYYCLSLVLLLGMLTFVVSGRAEKSPEASVKHEQFLTPQESFAHGDFEQTLALIESGAQDPFPAFLHRLKWLSLVRLGKTSEGFKAFEQYSARLGREEELLLRELAMNSILPFRTDMREQVRGAAYTALKEIESDDVVPYLEEGLTDGTGMVRALIAEGLGNLDLGQQSKQLHALVDDQAGFVRATVLKGLGKSGNKKFVPVLKRFLDDEQPLVQVAAAGGLILLGHDEYWNRITSATQASEGYERGTALRMLGMLEDPRALPLLQQGLLDPQPSIRAAAVSSLGKLGLPESTDLLLAMLSDRIPAVQSVAAMSLGMLRAERAVPALTRALHNANPGVRAAAAAGLLEMSSPYGVVADTIQALMGEKNPGLRSAAAKVLAKGLKRDVMGPLILLAQDPVPKPRISAFRSIGRLGGRDVIPILKRGIQDGNEAVRATAAGAIARVLSHSSGT